MSKKKVKEEKYNILYIIGTILFSGLTFYFGNLAGFKVETRIEPLVKENPNKIVVSDDQLPAAIDGDLGEIYDDIIPTLEEVDGGKFEDIETGLSLKEGEYAELGSIELVDTTSVAIFTRDTIGRCIVANNRFGAQCVSLARAFWWSYANRDVSTCGTGLAKGMMECSEQNAGEEFKTIWNTEEIIPGTWVVLNGGYTGHICMALGKPANGYVTCLGENQGGKSCGDGIMGAATNIVNINLKNFIGGYIPKTYIPAPIVPDTGIIK